MVSVATSGPLDVLDGGVRSLGAGVGDTVDNEDLDRWPPAAQGVPEPVGFVYVRHLDMVAQAHLLLVGVSETGAGQQAPQLLLRTLGGGELPGRIIGGEH